MESRQWAFRLRDSFNRFKVTRHSQMILTSLHCLVKRRLKRITSMGDHKFYVMIANKILRRRDNPAIGFSENHMFMANKHCKTQQGGYLWFWVVSALLRQSCLGCRLQLTAVIQPVAGKFSGLAMRAGPEQVLPCNRARYEVPRGQSIARHVTATAQGRQFVSFEMQPYPRV